MTDSDIFIMYPVSGKLKMDVECSSEYLAMYNDSLKSTSYYECDEAFASTIERMSIGEIKLSFMTDEYFGPVAEWIDAFCCYSYQKVSDLGVLQILLPLCPKDDSQIGDIVFSGHLRVHFKGTEYPIADFIRFIGLVMSGKPRIIYCNARDYKSDGHIGYLLAGETAFSDHGSYKIRREVLDRLESNNAAKYDFYDLYLSQTGIVYLIDGFSDVSAANLENESLLIFICEIAILQNAAISRINGQIVDELMQNSNISASKTLKLQVEFGKTILLWDNSIYRYYISQALSDDIVKAFGTDRLLEEYKRNSSHIEQIAALKNGISSEIEGRILNILAFILSISELIQIVRGLINVANGHFLEIGLSGGGIALLIVILLLIRRKSGKRTRN